MYCFIIMILKQYGALSDFKYSMIFPSEFSLLPRKINDYLRAYSPQDANTRNTIDLCKTLNNNSLHQRDIFPPCNKHHFSIQLSPYQGLKNTLSQPNMGLNGSWNGQYQKVKRIIPDYVIGYIKIQHGLKEPLQYLI